jgi:predicted DCC family thiol-disulfide oxidoreductase YuxK
MSTEASQPPAPLIVLFDGSCGLCDRAVRFILQRDPHRRFRFAPQQSPVGKDLMAKHQIDPEKLQSIVVVENDRVYTRSTAALRIATELTEPWPLAGVLIFLPAEWRDAAYDFIARHRKQWFKPPDACRTPTPQEREQFLV